VFYVFFRGFDESCFVDVFKVRKRESGRERQGREKKTRRKEGKGEKR